MTTASTLHVRVERKAAEALDICTFELVDASGGALPAFSAGSHIDVHLPDGLVRQYSLCNDPCETHRYVIGVLRDAASRGGSRAMHERVQPGQMLQISAPRNHFPLVQGNQRSLLLAGGIGVTPILCMAERLDTLGAEFEFHYCTRSRGRTAFYERIAGAAFAHRVQFHHDDGAPEQKLQLDALLARQPAETHLYVCGPKGFMDAVLDAARARGWPSSHLHYEYFAAEPIRHEADAGFQVKLASSGRVIQVRKEETLIQALAAAGVAVPTSCEQGVCGTCLTRVLDGEPDHRDLYLTPEEQAANDQMLPCCSRSRSALLVLDL